MKKLIFVLIATVLLCGCGRKTEEGYYNCFLIPKTDATSTLRCVSDDELKAYEKVKEIIE